MTRRAIVICVGLIALVAFAGAAFVYDRSSGARATATAARDDNTLVRPHSPVIGPKDAKVTIVEFFDPSCEACRAFYPFVKRILTDFPKEVRLVLRWTPFHPGSDEAASILEAARLQDKFEPVLDILVARQPEWAVHGAPDLEKAWRFAQSAGLDTDRARRDAKLPAIAKALEDDVADVKANNVQQTPTFFVNGKPLTSFGPQQLYDLVRSEVERTKAGS